MLYSRISSQEIPDPVGKPRTVLSNIQVQNYIYHNMHACVHLLHSCLGDARLCCTIFWIARLEEASVVSS